MKRKFNSIEELEKYIDRNSVKGLLVDKTVFDLFINKYPDWVDKPTYDDIITFHTKKSTCRLATKNQYVY